MAKKYLDDALLEDGCLAHPIELFPHAVPFAEAPRHYLPNDDAAFPETADHYCNWRRRGSDAEAATVAGRSSYALPWMGRPS